jgi:hypothetical protein
MAMTAAVKDELSRLSVTRPCCRKAEISALLRFAGGLHLVGGPEGTGPTAGRSHSRIVVEAELDTGSTARRLRKELARSTATPATSTSSPPVACARATATSCASPRTARGWPARPGSSTATAARCGAARRRW